MDSVDFNFFLPPEHLFSCSSKNQGHFSSCRVIILLVWCSMSIETDVLVVKKKLKSTESIHCIFSMHFFEVCPGPDLHKWNELQYTNKYLACRSGPGKSSKQCIGKMQCMESVDLNFFLPPERRFQWT